MTHHDKTSVSRRHVVQAASATLAAAFAGLFDSGGMTPLGRSGQPAELASIYVQRAAADASNATG